MQDKYLHDTAFFSFSFPPRPLVLYVCLVENRSKRDLIQMLVQRGYESDPVKAWKEAQEKVII